MQTQTGNVVIEKYTHVKVFSATKGNDRDALGEKVSEWISRENPSIVSTVVTQSSDAEFHCFTITLFYNKRN